MGFSHSIVPSRSYLAIAMPTLDLAMTEARVRAAQPGNNYRDETVRCLYLRVSETAKTFRWSGWSKADGQPMNVSLGAWPALTVDAARIKAKQVDARNAAGESLRKKVEAPKEDEEVLTLGIVAASYTGKLKREGKRTVDWLADAVRLNFKDWEGKPLEHIAHRALNDRLDTIHDTRGIGAKRTAVRGIRAIYSHASKAMGYTGPNPAKGASVPTQTPRQRILSATEKAAFIAAIDDPSEMPHIGDFFRLLAMTGARRANLEQAEWCDIDLETCWWRVPAERSKNGKEMALRLNAAAVAILTKRKEAKDAHARWVFPSPFIEDAHLGDTWQQWRRVAKRAGLPLEGKDKCTPHDIRRTFGSDLMTAGEPLHVVSRALGHGSIQTTARHYVVAGDTQVASGVDRLAGW